MITLYAFLLHNINVHSARSLRNVMKFLHHLDPQKTSFQLRRHAFMLYLDRKSKNPAEGSNTSLAQNQVNRSFLLCVLERRNVLLPTNLRHQRKKLSIIVWNVLRPRSRATDCQVAGARPLAMDVRGIFDAGAFELNQVMADSVADVDIRVIRMILLVGLLPGEVLQIGHVLMLSSVRMVGKGRWDIISQRGKRYVSHFFEIWAHRIEYVLSSWCSCSWFEALDAEDSDDLFWCFHMIYSHSHSGAVRRNHACDTMSGRLPHQSVDVQGEDPVCWMPKGRTNAGCAPVASSDVLNVPRTFTPCEPTSSQAYH